MNPSKKKGVIIGLGIVGIVGVILYARHKNSASSSTANPNLIMVSSANTNVNQYQNSSYLQALSAEAYLSKVLTGFSSQPGNVGTPTPTAGPIGSPTAGPTNGAGFLNPYGTLVG